MFFFFEKNAPPPHFIGISRIRVKPAMADPRPAADDILDINPLTVLDEDLATTCARYSVPIRTKCSFFLTQRGLTVCARDGPWARVPSTFMYFNGRNRRRSRWFLRHAVRFTSCPFLNCALRHHLLSFSCCRLTFVNPLLLFNAAAR
jgi:hypothetical protein